MFSLNAKLIIFKFIGYVKFYAKSSISDLILFEYFFKIKKNWNGFMYSPVSLKNRQKLFFSRSLITIITFSFNAEIQHKSIITKFFVWNSEFDKVFIKKNCFMGFLKEETLKKSYQLEFMSRSTFWPSVLSIVEINVSR